MEIRYLSEVYNVPVAIIHAFHCPKNLFATLMIFFSRVFDVMLPCNNSGAIIPRKIGEEEHLISRIVLDHERKTGKDSPILTLENEKTLCAAEQ